ncbi:hypothetical protein DO97_15955 [Neosynechococcus sphagnicola sy1]|uniref:Uncharacterized protein n=1 Tax=Neosynechococcus sphagnicola sy1 TaxID=1497020 RepID=A0A098TI57_9CYAN|nr:hypothetical protein DO97_15955 [Neosynechococcus sphagnicola sy1]
MNNKFVSLGLILGLVTASIFNSPPASAFNSSKMGIVGKEQLDLTQQAMSTKSLNSAIVSSKQLPQVTMISRLDSSQDILERLPLLRLLRRLGLI